MKTIELDVLSKDELKSVKGGQWVYNDEDGKWYWIEKLDLDDSNYLM